MIFALVLRNTSISSHIFLLEDFPFLSLLLLEKINSGATDAVKCTTQEKYLRMGACENILLEIPCFKPVNFQKKFLQYFIAVREQQRVQLSDYTVFCRENQELTELFSRGLLVGDSITSCTPDFWYMQISRRRGRTAPNFAI